MSNPLDQIRQLPVDQQLDIVHQIWDGLHESSELVQEWHIKEARRRSAEIEADPSIAISEDDVWKRVDGMLND
jgi:putative addiction module component (TIGR02574 family)